MLTLANNNLSIELLDPNDPADQARLGIRYCSGGYIFQASDPHHGPLLTGPTYPHDFNWFDGQGIPDAFNLSPLRTHEDGDQALIIGTGLCDLAAKTIIDPIRWTVTEEPGAFHFLASQEHRGWRLEIDRIVTLVGRTIRSWTRVTNYGGEPIPLRWFPHPFYPQPESDELIKLNIDVSFDTSDAYEIGDDGYIRRRGWPWTEGKFQPLRHEATERLVVQQRHPALGIVSASMSYVPGFFPIWGNQHTFSWEPFFEATIHPRDTAEWSIDYDF